MQLEIGKRYVTRSGLISGPMRNSRDSQFPFRAEVRKGYGSEVWRDDGSWHLNAFTTNDLDLVAEYVEIATPADTTRQETLRKPQVAVAPPAPAAVQERNENTDAVNHPKHYTSHPSDVECITIARHFGFNLGNVIKYLWRAPLKGATVEDLKKARWYLDDEIRRLESTET